MGKKKNNKTKPTSNDNGRKSSSPVSMGLQNLGNTCFMNCGLQCLASCTPLVKRILDKHLKQTSVDLSERKPSERNLQRIAEAFHEFIRARDESDRSRAVFSPTSLKRALGNIASHFAGYEQQDALDMMATLLNALSDAYHVPNANKLEPEDGEYNSWDDDRKLKYSQHRLQFRQGSLITDLFFGFQKNTVKCSECHTPRVRFQHYSFLSVPLLMPDQCDSLDKCLETFCRPSPLADGSEWQCQQEKCNGRHCTFHVQPYTLPTILIIHLRRFTAKEMRGPRGKAVNRMVKLNHLVTFPETLNMEPFVENKSQFMEYNLVAVARHHGTLDGGHYNAHCLVRGDWVACDDSSVYRVDKRQVFHDSSALILLYVKCSEMTDNNNQSSSSVSGEAASSSSLNKPDRTMSEESKSLSVTCNDGPAISLPAKKGAHSRRRSSSRSQSSQGRQVDPHSANGGSGIAQPASKRPAFNKSSPGNNPDNPNQTNPSTSNVGTKQTTAHSTTDHSTAPVQSSMDKPSHKKDAKPEKPPQTISNKQKPPKGRKNKVVLMGWSLF